MTEMPWADGSGHFLCSVHCGDFALVIRTAVTHGAVLHDVLLALLIQISHLQGNHAAHIIRNRIHVYHFGDVEMGAIRVLLCYRLIGKGHLAAQHDERSGNQRFKQFHYLCPNGANE